MTKNELAIHESILLWEELARTGSVLKNTAIKNLYLSGALTKDHYYSGCPLCDNVYNGLGVDCKQCPWLQKDSDPWYVRCVMKGSPYVLWEDTIADTETMKALAQDVLDLIRTFKAKEI